MIDRQERVLTECKDIMTACVSGLFNYDIPYCELYDSIEYKTKEYMKNFYAVYTSPDKVLINMEYFKDFNKREKITVIFHELVHAYCWRHEIDQVEEKKGFQFHTKGYKEAVEKHGGICNYVNDLIGYNDIILTKKAINRVKAELTYYTSLRIL